MTVVCLLDTQFDRRNSLIQNKMFKITIIILISIKDFITQNLHCTIINSVIKKIAYDETIGLTDTFGRI